MAAIGAALAVPLLTAGCAKVLAVTSITAMQDATTVDCYGYFTSAVTLRSDHEAAPAPAQQSVPATPMVTANPGHYSDVNNISNGEAATSPAVTSIPVSGLLLDTCVDGAFDEALSAFGAPAPTPAVLHMTVPHPGYGIRGGPLGPPATATPAFRQSTFLINCPDAPARTFTISTSPGQNMAAAPTVTPAVQQLAPNQMIEIDFAGAVRDQAAPANYQVHISVPGAPACVTTIRVN